MWCLAVVLTVASASWAATSRLAVRFDLLRPLDLLLRRGGAFYFVFFFVPSLAESSVAEGNAGEVAGGRREEDKRKRRRERIKRLGGYRSPGAEVFRPEGALF